MDLNYLYQRQTKTIEQGGVECAEKDQRVKSIQ